MSGRDSFVCVARGKVRVGLISVQWRDDAHPGTHRDQQVNIGPRYPGVKYIATNSDFQPLKLTSPSADGKRIQEGLSWVLVAPISAINYRAMYFFCQQLRAAGFTMPDYEDIRVHRVQGHGRINKGLAFFN